MVKKITARNQMQNHYKSWPHKNPTTWPSLYKKYKIFAGTFTGISGGGSASRGCFYCAPTLYTLYILLQLKLPEGQPANLISAQHPMQSWNQSGLRSTNAGENKAGGGEESSWGQKKLKILNKRVTSKNEWIGSAWIRKLQAANLEIWMTLKSSSQWAQL